MAKNAEIQEGEMVSVAEARAQIGHRNITLNSLYAAIRRGDVPHLRLGSKILIPRRWLLDKLAGNSGAHE